MKLTSLYDSRRQLLAIEFESVYLSRSSLIKILTQLDGMPIPEFRTAFSSDPDVFARFNYRRNQYIIIEPYGDSSRYWCGPEDEHAKEDFCEIEKVFMLYEPSFFRRVAGDLLSIMSKSDR